MSVYIDFGKTAQMIEARADMLVDGKEAFFYVAKWLELLPKIEVVHCKECKYWQDNGDGYPHPECRWGRGETPDADDYCSYGEKMENGD